MKEKRWDHIYRELFFVVLYDEFMRSRVFNDEISRSRILWHIDFTMNPVNFVFTTNPVYFELKTSRVFYLHSLYGKLSLHRIKGVPCFSLHRSYNDPVLNPYADISLNPKPYTSTLLLQTSYTPSLFLLSS